MENYKAYLLFYIINKNYKIIIKKFPATIKAVKWKQAFLGSFTTSKISVGVTNRYSK